MNFIADLHVMHGNEDTATYQLVSAGNVNISAKFQNFDKRSSRKSPSRRRKRFFILSVFIYSRC